MAFDHIRYDVLAQAALRGVVRTVLADVAKNGLPGEHHFRITFNTMAPGVRLSDRMRAQYPQDMTIVLQHQFWDLAVTEQAFEVGLSFGGIPERVGAPFEAVTAFYDPAVQFGFQFEAVDGGAAAEASAATQTVDKSAAPAPALTAGERPEPLPAPAAVTPPAPAPDGADAGGEVVRLDRFRKK
ncbi:MAG TPA: ClpXP protease specificity-enhancing factor SspB [Xanthobacteraceae bacterium]|nr:ClpXP protease specificity-enhancing factor SspB [Xanthobacteraceae bacterium]